MSAISLSKAHITLPPSAPIPTPPKTRTNKQDRYTSQLDWDTFTSKAVSSTTTTTTDDHTLLSINDGRASQVGNRSERRNHATRTNNNCDKENVASLDHVDSDPDDTAFEEWNGFRRLRKMSCEKSAFSEWSTDRDVKLSVPNETMERGVVPKQQQHSSVRQLSKNTLSSLLPMQSTPHPPPMATAIRSSQYSQHSQHSKSRLGGVCCGCGRMSCQRRSCSFRRCVRRVRSFRGRRGTRFVRLLICSLTMGVREM